MVIWILAMNLHNKQSTQIYYKNNFRQKSVAGSYNKDMHCPI